MASSVFRVSADRMCADRVTSLCGMRALGRVTSRNTSGSSMASTSCPLSVAFASCMTCSRVGPALGSRSTAATHHVPITDRARDCRGWLVWWADYDLRAAFNNFRFWSWRFDQICRTTLYRRLARCLKEVVAVGTLTFGSLVHFFASFDNLVDLLFS